MTFDPITNYGDTDLTIDENLVCWKFAELIKSLITLSSSADRQIEIIGYAAVADEMAINFDNYYTIEENSYLDNNLLTTTQNNILKELDTFFEKRSGDKYPEFWDDFQLATNSDWIIVRKKAKNLLQILGMDNLEIMFDRKEKFEKIGQKTRLVFQSTKTRLVDKNDSLHRFSNSGAGQ